MYYINESTLEYPLTETYVRSLYPNTSFPQPFIPPKPFAIVNEVNTLEYDADTQRMIEVSPVKESDGWKRKWEIRNLSQEEIEEIKKIKKNRIITQLINSVQSRLDAFARSRNYDNILSACTYATSSITKFKSEGQCCVKSRDDTWVKLFEILAQIDKGDRPLPESYADIESELPVLEWPSASA